MVISVVDTHLRACIGPNIQAIKYKIPRQTALLNNHSTIDEMSNDLRGNP